MQLERFSSKKRICFTEKAFFQLMQDQPIKKSFFQRGKLSISHRNKTNVQQPFSNTACHCELAERCLFFETSQPCVSTTVTLSHRFKSSPSIPGKVKMPDAAGYLMNAGHFRQNHESSGDLNRPRESRGSQPSACFCGTFCTPQKVPIRTPLPGTSRFCKPRISPTK